MPMSEALEQNKRFAEAVARRALKASEAVWLPVKTLDARTREKRRHAEETGKGVSVAYVAAENAGAHAKRSGLPASANPYHPRKAASWHRRWLKGWERV